jgi:hypothetical protein
MILCVHELSDILTKENDMLNKLRVIIGLPTAEDKFFADYTERQRLNGLRSVHTASSRPTKPGVFKS